jgi:hypothetical protein
MTIEVWPTKGIVRKTEPAGLRIPQRSAEIIPFPRYRIKKPAELPRRSAAIIPFPRNRIKRVVVIRKEKAPNETARPAPQSA